MNRRLLRVELRRYRARRVTLWVTIGLLAVVALSTLVAALTARPPSAAEVAQAHKFYEQQAADWEKNGDQMVSDCHDAEQSDPNPDADYGCDQMEPKLEQFLPAPTKFFPSQRELAAAATSSTSDGTPGDPAIARASGTVWNTTSGLGAIDDLAPVLLFAVFLVAVSFVTAELASGAIGLWLTFVPGRTRVYWSKAGAAAIAALPVVVVGFTLLASGSFGAYALIGTVGDAPDGVAAHVAAFVGRLALAGVAVSLVGVALGLLLRHAAAAIGVAAAWVGAESLFRYQLGDLQRWLFSVNLSAWLHGGEVFTTNRCEAGDDGSYVCTTVEHLVTPVQGGVFLLALTAVLTLVAFLVFRRRDVA
ncbi:hypothetical protein [Xylanimonas sp. McL0601]|uniref:hypothetical protein n=1 Tax=Xylanimonas sp. McL0601 TaxID=3414739 RepID=UPI003CEE7B3D